MGSPRLLAAMMLLFLARSSLSQPQTNFATDLYIGFMRTTVTTGSVTFYDPNVLITTESTTNSTFSITRADGDVESIDTNVTSVLAPADLALAHNLITLDGNTRENGILVTSNGAPISAVVYPYDFQGISDAFLALPCHDTLMGSNYEYYAVAFKGVESSGIHSQIMLVGCRPSTNITITPTQTITIPSDLNGGSNSVTLSPGQSHSFFLNSLETFLITSNTSDLTGTRIVSNKPLTVTSGSDCARVPQTSNSCEYLVEQIPPTATWGYNFVLVPFRGRETGQYYKVVTSQDNTVMKLTCKNDSLTRDITLSSAGDFSFFFTAADVYCSLESNGSIIVVQVALGHSGDGKGDPVMILVAPLDEFVPSVNFQSLRVKGTFRHYVNVMVSDEDFSPSMIQYDNGIVASNTDCNWQPVFGSNSQILGWGCNFEITAGQSHNMRHTGADGRVFVMVYGFRELTSVTRAYGYPAGLALDYHLRTVTLNASSYMVVEDDGFVAVQLQYQGITTDPVIVHLEAISQTSMAGEDYNAIVMDIEFDFNDLSKTVKIPIINDNLSEPIETFLLVLTPSPNSPSSVTTTPIHNAVVTIKDDDAIYLDVASRQADSTENVLVVDVVIARGMLQQSNNLSVLLTIETQRGTETYTGIELSSYVTKLVVEFDVSRLIPMSRADETLEFIATLTSRDTTGIVIGSIPSSVTITRIPATEPTLATTGDPNLNGTFYRLDSVSSPVWISVIIAFVVILALIITIVIVSVSCYYLGRRMSEYHLMYSKRNSTSVTVTEILETHDNKAYHSSATNHTFGFADDSNV